jgi:hypothetical protein
VEAYEPIEQAILRQAIRDAHTKLGWKDSTVLYEHLLSNDEEFKNKSITKDWKDNFIKYIRGQSIAKENVAAFSPFIANILLERVRDLENFYDKKARSYKVLLSVLNREPFADIKSDAAPSTVTNVSTAKGNLEKIVENFHRPAMRGNRWIVTGIYQIYRRYKPTAAQRLMDFYQDDNNHPVICELAYVDSTTMECMIITTERNLYWGISLYKSSRNTLRYCATSE